MTKRRTNLSPRTKSSASSTPTLSIIVPMHNEEQSMDAFFETLLPILKSLKITWEIIAINDGSCDNTYAMLNAYHKKEARIKALHLSRNFGKEAAMTAGLAHATGKAVIPIDADLQDPPDMIPQMIVQWKEGYKVVLATRKSRGLEHWTKRLIVKGFYKTIGKLSSVKIPENTGDFRLMDRVVVDVINQMPERTRFMKGIFAWPGFSTTTLYFDRHDRIKGSSKWSYLKLWQHAIDGIASFTTAPLKIWTYIGSIISLLSFAYALMIIIKTLILGIDVPGYASIMTAVLFMGGIQLISIGVLGEYIARIFKETKQRPLYVVAEKTGL